MRRKDLVSSIVDAIQAIWQSGLQRGGLRLSLSLEHGPDLGWIDVKQGADERYLGASYERALETTSPPFCQALAIHHDVAGGLRSEDVWHDGTLVEWEVDG